MNTETTQPGNWLLTELCATLHALSSDAPAALALQDPDLRRPDQLALKFGEAVLSALSRDPIAITPDQLQVLNELAVVLRNMSAQHRDLWTEEAVRSHPAWQQVRELATTALKLLEAHAVSSRTVH